MRITIRGARGELEAFESVRDAGAYLRKHGFGERHPTVPDRRNLSDEELLERAAALTDEWRAYWRVEFGP